MFLAICYRAACQFPNQNIDVSLFLLVWYCFCFFRGPVFPPPAMKPILTLVGSAIFLIFVGRSIWSIYSIWQAPKCNPLIQEPCYHSFLNDNPKLDLLVFTADNSKSGKFELILWLEDFDYRNQIERYFYFTANNFQVSYFFKFRDVTVKIPKTVKQNGTMFIHTVITPKRHTRTTKDLQKLVNLEDVTYIKGQLINYNLNLIRLF